MRVALVLLAVLVASHASAQGTGTIAGQVFEVDGVTAVIGANVRIEGTTLGAATDIDGNYRIIGVPLGTHNVTASAAGMASAAGYGYLSQTQTGVDVNAGITRQLNFTLAATRLECLAMCWQPALLPTSPYISYVTVGDGVEEIDSGPCPCSWPASFWSGR